ncbi:MAG: carboxypeptidase regulatory-like domain-containing protein [Nitrospinae bacterium]|nr:carboxypeptidase regulatory-like domain-containing protein [Nitrospinota bacterium]
MDRRLFITNLATIPAGLMAFGFGDAFAEKKGKGKKPKKEHGHGDGTSSSGTTTQVIITVYGLVSSKINRGPIAGATVIVLDGPDSNSAALGTGTTDSDGLYKVSGISVGLDQKIRVECDALGCEPALVRVKGEKLIVCFDSKEKGSGSSTTNSADTGSSTTDTGGTTTDTGGTTTDTGGAATDTGGTDSGTGGMDTGGGTSGMDTGSGTGGGSDMGSGGDNNKDKKKKDKGGKDSGGGKD